MGYFWSLYLRLSICLVVWKNLRSYPHSGREGLEFNVAVKKKVYM